MATQFGEDHGLLHEAVVTGRKVGAGKDFWSALAHNEQLFARVVAFVVEALRVVFTLVAKIDRDMTGWTCVEPVNAEEEEFKPTLHEFLREGEGSINGEEMIRRAKEQGVLTGLRHAEAILRNQEKIPVEWRKHYLVFPEVWQGPGGGRNVFYLYWGGRRWYLVCGWLGDDFYSRSRLVGSRKLTQLNSPKG